MTKLTIQSDDKYLRSLDNKVCSGVSQEEERLLKDLVPLCTFYHSAFTGEHSIYLQVIIWVLNEYANIAKTQTHVFI